jgi:hypothetical protein
MALTTEFTHSLQVLHRAEKIDENRQTGSGFTGYPALEEVLARLLPLPENGLFLGVASDGLPVFLNLKDPRPGPLLLLGDSHTGKTDFLRGVARGASLAYHPQFLRFAVVTSYPNEWAGWEGSPHCHGVLKPADPRLNDLLIDLLARTQAGNNSEAILLLVDDLGSLMDCALDFLENLRCLLENGTARQMWTIATLNADQAVALPNWLGAFHTRLFGRIKDPQLADRLTFMPGANLRTLLSGRQFCIRERNHWLRFWLPLSK